jgi:tetratricopeptide (TPR) repeat protein
MKFWLSFLLLLPLCFAAPRVSAHAVTHSYLELTRAPERISGRWRVATVDLDAVIGLDDDANGRIDDAEVSDRRAAIESYLLSRLELSNAEGPCTLVPSSLRTSGRYLVLELSSDCAGSRAVRYDLFFDHDRTHQGYLHVSGGGELVRDPDEHLDDEFDFVFTSTRRSSWLAVSNAAGAHWLQYLVQGIYHILIGADHVLFLLTLLLAAVLRRESGRYEPVASFRSAFVGVAKIVTAFTAAHSLSLTAMALGVVAPPPRWIETAIALSIVAAAANNLWPVITRRVWLVALAFGLIHGLGFAGVLLELGLPKERLLIALLGFNLGVEVGQLAIVGVCFPLAFWLRRRRAYPRIALGFGSVAIGAIGLVWSLERALDAKWSTRLASLLADQPPSAGAGSVRPCPGLVPLATPALYDAVMKTPNPDATALAARGAYELACAGQLEHSARAYADALAAAPAATPALGWLLSSYAEVEDARGERRHTEQLLERAQTVWREQGADQPLADTLARAGDLLARDEQWADVFRLYDEARTLHEKAGDTAGLAKDLSRLADVLVSAADTGAAKRLYERARAAYEQLGDSASVAAQYRNLAIVARLDADPRTAAQMYRRAIELHRKADNQPELASDLAALARTQLGMAEYDEAKASYAQANAIESELGRSRALSRNYNQLGNLHQLRGELGAAEAMYREALRVNEAARDTTEAANNWANLASVQHKLGRTDEARAMYERSLSLFEQGGAKSKVMRVRGLLATLERRRPPE